MKTTSVYLFRWQGINQQGELLSGRLRAHNTKQVKQQLQQQHITALKINRLITLTKKFRLKHKLNFYSQLHNLLDANIALLDAIPLLKHNPNIAPLLDQLHQRLASGMGLSDAIQMPLATTLERKIMAIGEQCRQLPTPAAYYRSASTPPTAYGTNQKSLRLSLRGVGGRP